MEVQEYFELFPELNINDLNDDCMISILQWIPLAELLRLEIVCHRWKNVQEILFRSRKNKLVLVDINTIGIKNPIQEIKSSYLKYGVSISKSYHHLRVDLNKKKNAELLLNKFPNICKLEVVYDKLENIASQLLMLLDAWKDNLFHLKVLIYDSVSSGPSWKRLFEESITKLSLLKHLTVKDNSHNNFHAREEQNNANREPLFVLPTELAARLEEYFFALGAERMTNIFAQLNQFHADSKLGPLSLISHEYNENGTPSLDDVDEAFANKHITLSLLWNQSQQIRREREQDGEQPVFQFQNPMLIFMQAVCTKFSSLTSLHINIEFEFAQIAPKLAKLKQLTDLRLPFSSRIFPRTEIIARLQALSTIQHLHLDCSRPYHYHDGNENHVPHDELRFVEHLLPNLAVIKVNVSYDIGDFFCKTCDSSIKEDCRKAFLSSLANFNLLRRVYLLTSNGYSGWEELYNESLLAHYDVIYMLSGKEVLTVKQKIPL